MVSIDKEQPKEGNREWQAEGEIRIGANKDLETRVNPERRFRTINQLDGGQEGVQAQKERLDGGEPQEDEVESSLHGSDGIISEEDSSLRLRRKFGIVKEDYGLAGYRNEYPTFLEEDIRNKNQNEDFIEIDANGPPIEATSSNISPEENTQKVNQNQDQVGEEQKFASNPEEGEEKEQVVIEEGGFVIDNNHRDMVVGRGNIPESDPPMTARDHQEKEGSSGTNSGSDSHLPKEQTIPSEAQRPRPEELNFESNQDCEDSQVAGSLATPTRFELASKTNLQDHIQSEATEVLHDPFKSSICQLEPSNSNNYQFGEPFGEEVEDPKKFDFVKKRTNSELLDELRLNVKGSGYIRELTAEENASNSRRLSCGGGAFTGLTKSVGSASMLVSNNRSKSDCKDLAVPEISTSKDNSEVDGKQEEATPQKNEDQQVSKEPNDGLDAVVKAMEERRITKIDPPGQKFVVEDNHFENVEKAEILAKSSQEEKDQPKTAKKETSVAKIDLEAEDYKTPKKRDYVTFTSKYGRSGTGTIPRIRHFDRIQALETQRKQRSDRAEFDKFLSKTRAEVKKLENNYNKKKWEYKRDKIQSLLTKERPEFLNSSRHIPGLKSTKFGSGYPKYSSSQIDSLAGTFTDRFMDEYSQKPKIAKSDFMTKKSSRNGYGGSKDLFGSTLNSQRSHRWLETPKTEYSDFGKNRFDRELQINKNLSRVGTGYLGMCQTVRDSLNALKNDEFHKAKNMLKSNKFQLTEARVEHGKKSLLKNGIFLSKGEDLASYGKQGLKTDFLGTKSQRNGNISTNGGSRNASGWLNH